MVLDEGFRVIQRGRKSYNLTIKLGIWIWIQEKTKENTLATKKK